MGVEDRAEWVETFSIGYGLPPKVSELFAPRGAGWEFRPDDPLQFFAVTRGGRIVATSVLILADRLAGICCVATLPDERKKGLGAHATAEPLRAVHQSGYRVGVLQSSEEGHGVYQELGFKDVSGIPMFVRMPG